MTKQEILNKVAPLMLAQNRKSEVKLLSTKKTACLYRHPEGLKCALGFLIPEEMYVPEMEEQTIRGMIDKDIQIPKFFKEHIHFLGYLQRVHDFNEPEMWKKELTNLALDYNLELPECLK